MRVAFRTIGCRLNQAETARIAAQFEAVGYEIVHNTDDADICIIHGCAVTEVAEKKCARLARSLKQGKRQPIVVLAGCIAEVGSKKLLSSSEADLSIGQADKFSIPGILATRLGLDTKAAHSTESDILTPKFFTTRALIPVQDGCNFRCSYCIVPEARGNPASRASVEILQEAERLADAGYREVVLTGANIGCYTDSGLSLLHLLEKIESIHGIERIRLSSIELSTIEADIATYMRSSEKLCRYLHIPLQSGSDRILTSMRRRYDTTAYRRAIEQILANNTPVGLGTDVIVGFPGEDHAAFAETVSFVKSLPFSNLHVFRYSKRPGTVAAEMPNHIQEQEKKNRSNTVMALGQELKRTFAAQFTGKSVSLLVEKVSDKGLASGWTGEYVEAAIYGEDLNANQIITFEPTSLSDTILQGEAPSK